MFFATIVFLKHDCEEFLLLALFVNLKNMLSLHRKNGTTFCCLAPNSENTAQEVNIGGVILHDLFIFKALSQIFVVSDGIESQNDSLIEPVEESNFRLDSHLFLINYSILKGIIGLFHKPSFIVSRCLFLHLAIEDCFDPVSQNDLLNSVTLQFFQFLMHLVHICYFLDGDKSRGKKLFSSIVISFAEIHCFG